MKKSSSLVHVLSFDDVTSLYVRVLRMLAILPMKGRDYDFPITRILSIHCLSGTLADLSFFLFYGYACIKEVRFI